MSINPGYICKVNTSDVKKKKKKKSTDMIPVSARGQANITAVTNTRILPFEQQQQKQQQKTTPTDLILCNTRVPVSGTWSLYFFLPYN